MKNRKQIDNNRRNKATKRAKRDKPRQKAPKFLPRMQPDTDPIEDVKNRWFAVHGLNYLASDYTTGEWTPYFDVYGDDLLLEKIPTIQQAFTAVTVKNYDNDTEQWTTEGKLLASWLMVAPETMRGIRMALLRHLTVEDNVEAAADELVKPHNPRVWAFFHDQIRSRTISPDEGDADQSQKAEAVEPTEDEVATSSDGDTESV